MRRAADRAHAGPPPPAGYNRLVQVRWQTSATDVAGEVRPTCAFMFSPSDVDLAAVLG